MAERAPKRFTCVEYALTGPTKDPPNINFVACVQNAASSLTGLFHNTSVTQIAAGYWRYRLKGSKAVVHRSPCSILAYFTAGKPYPQKLEIDKFDFAPKNPSPCEALPAEASFPAAPPTLDASSVHAIESFIQVIISRNPPAPKDETAMTTKELKFLLNGHLHTIPDPDPKALLFDYLHTENVGLTGTKTACRQGGCGACTVQVSRPKIDENGRIVPNQWVHESVNSCLRPLASLQGQLVTTVEGVVKNGKISPVQDKIVRYAATQCGYCTPGWVMAGHSYLTQKQCVEGKKVTCADIEDMADGNLCRCTGNRPLLTALKSLADDNGQGDCKDNVDEAIVPKQWEQPVATLQELVPDPAPFIRNPVPPLLVRDPLTNLPVWAQPQTLPEVKAIYDEVQSRSADWPIKYQSGNTGTGIYPDLVDKTGSGNWVAPKLRIDLCSISEMNVINVSAGLLNVGAAVTYTRFMDFLDSNIALQNPQQERFKELRYLAQRTAGYQLRNRATLGGNTMMVAQHYKDPSNPPFPSDLCTGLLAVDTSVSLYDVRQGTLRQLPLSSFIASKLNINEILVGYKIPIASPANVTANYKTAIRRTMAHSYVNGGFSAEVIFDQTGKLFIFRNVKIAIGGIGPTQMATRAASIMEGSPVNQDTLSKSVDVLQKELMIWVDAYQAWKRDNRAAYPFNGEDERLYLVPLGVSYLYKFFVKCAKARGIEVSASVAEIGLPDDLPVSYAHVTYKESAGKEPKRKKAKVTAAAQPSDTSVAHQPLIKYEAYAQTKGEVKYVRETPPPGRAVYFSWVYSLRIGKYAYEGVEPGTNPSDYILKTLRFKYGSEQVVDYVTHADFAALPQDFNADFTMSPGLAIDPTSHETLLFKGDTVQCVGERLALVVATDEKMAQKIAEDVMKNMIRWQQIPDIKLKLEDYQTNPEGPPDPTQWAAHRRFLPGDGVCYPKETPRDGQIIGDKQYWLQNVVERPPHDPTKESGWQQKVLENVGKKVALPFYVPQGDGSEKYYQADCFIIMADHRTTEQMHFYLESNAVIAELTNAGVLINASTQSPAECQSKVAAFLNMRSNQVDVQVKQIGGGYGGKTVRSPFHAVAAAALAKKLQRPTKLAIEREADSAITGRRHSYYLRVYLGVVADDRNPELAEHRGTIAAFYMQVWSDSGWYYDCTETVLNVAIEDSDGSYFSRLFRAEGQILRTNKVSNTAMRAFGHSSIMAIENAIEAAGHCPEIFKVDGDGNSTSIRIRSLYRRDQTTPYGSVLSDCILDQMFYTMRTADWYLQRLTDIRAFNQGQRWKKRGHCLQPGKYKVGFEFGSLEQGHAIVNVFSGDGSVLVMHDGVELGQGLSTKCIQIAATELGLPIELIQIGTTGAKVTPNPTSTGASSGSELKGGATLEACKILKQRLEAFAMSFYKKNASMVARGEVPVDKNYANLAFWNFADGWAHVLTPAANGQPAQYVWNHIVTQAYFQRQDLSAEGYYTNPYFNANPSSSDPQVYAFVYAMAYSEVEIDVLTGATSIVETRLVVDAGKSMNPAVDIGQIEGAFIQGVGSVLTEHVLFEPDGQYKGAMVSDNTWVYKPPFPRDIPLKWWTNIYPSDKYNIPLNEHLVMSSKAMGEPPYILSTSVYCALKEAIFAAKQQNIPNYNGEWFLLPTPVTPQDVRKACGVDISNYQLVVPDPKKAPTPLATQGLLKYQTRRQLDASSSNGPEAPPPSLAMFASVDRNRSLRRRHDIGSSVRRAFVQKEQQLLHLDSAAPSN